MVPSIKERALLIIEDIKTRMKQDTREGLLVNVAVLASIVLGLMLLFFYIYLPIATKHFNSLSMPDLIGKSEAEVIEILDDAGLRYEIIDSTYVRDAKPMSVVSQNPKPKTEVKDNRKVYLIIQKTTPPDLKIPKDIIGQSEKNAREQLQAHGFTVSGVIKTAWCYEGSVLGIRINGSTYRKASFGKALTAKYTDRVELIISDGSIDDCIGKEY
jgi:hypothetical protein